MKLWLFVLALLSSGCGVRCIGECNGRFPIGPCEIIVQDHLGKKLPVKWELEPRDADVNGVECEWKF